jgi:hypothetical protein
LSFTASQIPLPQKIFLTKWNDVVVLTKKCKCYIKCNKSPEIFGRGSVMHSHDADSEACFNRQILNNSVERKAMEDLCERPGKLIHKELRSQYVDTLIYKNTENISRNTHKTRSSQLLLLPTDIEETHEALSAVLVLTSSTELAC